MFHNEHPTRGAGRPIAALALLLLLGMGCASTPNATPDETSGRDEEAPQADAPEGPESPPPVQLLSGAAPTDGVLIYESWVTDGELRTTEPAAIPADLVAVPWRPGEPLTFGVTGGKGPLWVDVLVFDELPADRVPTTEPERIQCVPSEAESPCRVGEGPDDSLEVTVQAAMPSDIVILNIGWARPERSADQDPNLPLEVSASWAFAVETNP